MVKELSSVKHDILYGFSVIFFAVTCFFTVAVDKLPNFLASPTPDDKPGPHHQCSIHLNCESVEVLETAYKEAMNGRPSARSSSHSYTSDTFP